LLARELATTDLPAKLGQAMAVLGSIALAVAVYFLIALLTRSPEIQNLREALVQRRQARESNAS
jgi:hypothetical protein